MRAASRGGCAGTFGGLIRSSASRRSHQPLARRMTRTSSSIERPCRAARRRSSYFSLSSSCRTVRLAIGASSNTAIYQDDDCIAINAIIAILKAIQSNSDGDDPERSDGPPREARFGLVDLGEGPRRQQQQAVAGDLVELFEHARAARQQAGHLAEKAADVARTLRGVFELAGRAEIARHPFAHDRLGGASTCRAWDRASAPRPRPPPWSFAAAAIPAACACRTGR